MATGCLRRGPVSPGWHGGLLFGVLWAAGCSSPPVSEPLVPPRVLAPGEVAARAQYQPAATDPGAPLQRVQHIEQAPPPRLLPPSQPPSADRHPIDLPTALRLAGANNLQIALAGERIREAQARLEAARAQWLPSLNAGLGYNHHDGRIQDTRGEILEVSRNALFVGGGPNLGPAPLTGPAGPNPRLFLGLPLADVLFAPLAQRQQVQAARAARAATFNDTLLAVASTYLDLVLAQSQVAIAGEAVTNARELVRLIESRVRAGTAPPADGLRAQAELAERQRQQFQAEEAVRVVAAELVRLLRLDPAVTLFPLEGEPAPIALVAADAPLPALLAQGFSSRPELAAHQSLVNAALERLRQERWRPWFPTVQVGLSAGGFGGGEGSFLGNFSDRADFDALLVWELRNLGFGNRALQRERASQQVQARLTAEQVRDTIAAEVARAYYQVQLRQRQIEAARTQVRAAAEAVPLNFKGIVGGDLRAIEGQQAVQALAFARNQYLTAVIDHNRAQFELLRAIGQPLDRDGQCLPQ
ncbi:MAG: TolC family protein [Gemmataceae bacterium]|nr:TolC family protein [Gemmataceae bacterium]